MKIFKKILVGVSVLVALLGIGWVIFLSTFALFEVKGGESGGDGC